jgi:hypothetical protein
MNITTDLRVRSRLSDAAMETRKGKNLGDPDYDVLLTGAARVSKLDGRPLAIYLPGALAEQVDVPGVLDVLRSLWDPSGSNRGLASAAPRFGTGRGVTPLGHNPRTYGRRISSAIAGAVDPGGQQPYCRLTAWTGRHLAEWESLYPLLRAIAGHLAEHVPDRYAAQAREAAKTDPAWVVPGTPFTTITVNHSFATGTHTDRGDLDAGFSTITCLRLGPYTGGRLVFPQYRIAADLGHGDLILMDAHEWHGNTVMVCGCGREMKSGPCATCGAERISIVSYFRTKLTRCGTPDQEHDRANRYHEEIASRREARAREDTTA